IFCENVTIYFKIESTRRVIRNFYEALLEGGYLFLGYSETLWQISNDFVLRELDSAFFYQKLSESRATTEAPPSVPAIPSVQESPPHRSGPSRAAHRARGRWMSTPRLPKRVYTLEEAASLYEARRFEEALLAVEGLLSAEPGNASAHLLAAKLRADREEVGPALRHCRRALDANSLLEEGHYLMGVLLLRSGDSPAAADSLSRVIYLNPVGHRSALAHFHLAGLRTDVEDWEGAGREYRSALRLLERLPKDELVEEFSADFLARVCRRRLQELGREG
ncbi:MAG: CheR family methyltransferase, partial [Chloroflexota bacterium]